MSKAFKEISEYYSDEKSRTATIRLDLETGQYQVSVMNESGHSFSAEFITEEDAEGFAEEWVLR